MDIPSKSSLLRIDINCSTCRQPNLIAFQTFKNCANCREKNREKGRKKYLRATERKAAQQQTEQAMLAQHAKLPDSDSATKLIVEEQRTSTGATKRRTPLVTHDFNVEGALKRAKGALKKSESRGRNLPPTPAPFVPTPTEYQSASLMYGELQNEMCTQMNFSGYHSIVAMSDVNNAQRVDMARKDLHRIVHLPFDHKNPVQQRDSGFSLRFKCVCLGHDGDVPRECGGKVIITARADNSHRLVPGQVISVLVTH